MIHEYPWQALRKLQLHQFAVDAHPVIGADPLPGMGYRAIDADAPGSNPLFNLTPRTLPDIAECLVVIGVFDNERAATWLIERVFSKMDVPFVVAGMDPPPALRELAGRYAHIQLIGNPDDRQMRALIANAHINVLLSSQVAGIKLKLLNALFQGRFCIVNQAMVSGTHLAPLCCVCDGEATVRQAIATLMTTPFTQSQIDQRRAMLETEFSNQLNARKLMALIEFSQKIETSEQNPDNGVF